MDRSTDKACVDMHNLEIKNSNTTRKSQRSLEFANMEMAHVPVQCFIATQLALLPFKVTCSLNVFLSFNFSLSISPFQFLSFNFSLSISLSISLSNSLFLLSLFGRFSIHPLVCTYVPFRAGLGPSKPGLRQILPDLRPSQPGLRPSQPNRHRKSPHSTGLCPLLLLLSKRTKE